MKVAEIIDNNRKSLLQLDGTNPSINYREFKAKGVKSINDDIAGLLFKLINSSKLTFEATETSGRALLGTPGSSKKITLSFTGDEKALSDRLLKTSKDAQLCLDEQGINTLFLGLGMLEWKENELADKIWSAPLILLPVEIKKVIRTSKDENEEFFVFYTEEGIEQNHSLYEAVKERYGIVLPKMPNWEEYEKIDDCKNKHDEWLKEILLAINKQASWAINNNTVVLGFFSFNKYMMYKDLTSANWCNGVLPDGPDLMKKLLVDGFNEKEEYNNDTKLDDIIDASIPLSVLDMDSSQAKVLLEAKKANCLVVEGPPGTGKSQTITNLIADAFHQGKKILFVAEKMAALNVVKRNLNKVGLGPACLELHGSKGKKTAFIEELRSCIEKQFSATLPLAFSIEKLNYYRNKLKECSDAVNTKLEEFGYTPYELYGLLLKVDGIFKSKENVPIFTSIVDQKNDDFSRYLETVTKELIGGMDSLGKRVKKLKYSSNLYQRYQALQSMLFEVVN